MPLLKNFSLLTDAVADATTAPAVMTADVSTIHAAMAADATDPMIKTHIKAASTLFDAAFLCKLFTVNRNYRKRVSIIQNCRIFVTVTHF